MSSATPPPAPTTASALSWAIAGAILGATAMWFISTLSDLTSSTSGSKSKGRQAKSWPNNYDVKLHPDSSDEELMERLSKEPRTSAAAADSSASESDSEAEDTAGSSSYSTFPTQSTEECKLVLVVRTDLGMTKGKIAAQASHATLACYKVLARADASHPVLKRWERMGQAKIAVQCPAGGEEALVLLQAKAVSLGLCAQVIHDAGRTQIAAGSATVLGVGPGPRSIVDQVTGGLKLL